VTPAGELGELDGLLVLANINTKYASGIVLPIGPSGRENGAQG
jgi:hypothetical protein